MQNAARTTEFSTQRTAGRAAIQRRVFLKRTDGHISILCFFFSGFSLRSAAPRLCLVDGLPIGLNRRAAIRSIRSRHQQS